jgi:hypothetical protein
MWFVSHYGTHLLPTYERERNKAFMNDWFDDITRTLADDTLSRRQIVRKVASTMAGVALAAFLPADVLAKRKHGRCPYVDKTGVGGPTCFAGEPGCSGNQNCYSFMDISLKADWCGCNEYCSTAKPCTSDKTCAKGYFCSGCTGCGQAGICVQCCNKTCTLSSSHAGRTAADR